MKIIRALLSNQLLNYITFNGLSTESKTGSDCLYMMREAVFQLEHAPDVVAPTEMCQPSF